MEIDLNQHQVQLERLYNSQEFRLLERSLSNSNPRFRDLKSHQKLLALYLLKSVGDDAFDHMWTLFYKRKPPTIQEYLSPVYTPETSHILYPKWREVAYKTFEPGSTFYELIFGGSIGAGKSTAALILHCYNLIRVALLLNPHGVLGAAPNKGLILSLFTITLPKAKKALVEPFKALMLESRGLFEEVDRNYWKAGFPNHHLTDKIPFYDNNTELCMPNSISAMLGSQTSHALSFDMFGAFLDEAEFRDSGGDIDKAFEVYSNLKERVDSRFLDSRFKLVTLVSSARYSTGIIAQYTASIPEDSKTTMYLAYPIWEIKEFNAYSDGHFYVLRGNSNHPSKILDSVEQGLVESDNYVTPEGCELLKVPSVYKGKFEFRVEEAIRNLAGLQTLGADQPFPDTTQMVDKSLPAEFSLSAELPKGKDSVRIPLIAKIPEYVYNITPEGRRFKRYPGVARYAHVDLATVNVGGLTILHKELYKDRTMYVVDMMCSITSPTKIDLNAITDLLTDLHNTWGVFFHTITYDQFQSDAPRQQLEMAGVAKEIGLMSVDRTLLPYSEASRIVAAGQFKTGPCPLLEEQMKQVQLFPNRRSEKVKRGPAGKDQLDSMVGAVNNAINATDDVAWVQYEDINDKAYRDKASDSAFDGMEDL